MIAGSLTTAERRATDRSGAGAAPVREELVLVQFSPGEHEAKLSAAEAALDHLQRVDADLRAALGVAGVEVGRTVIVEVHRDHDAGDPARARTRACRTRRRT
jgi:hypothetical protein